MQVQVCLCTSTIQHRGILGGNDNSAQQLHCTVDPGNTQASMFCHMPQPTSLHWSATLGFRTPGMYCSPPPRYTMLFKPPQILV
jgi:hypothetical protein